MALVMVFLDVVATYDEVANEPLHLRTILTEEDNRL